MAALGSNIEPTWKSGLAAVLLSIMIIAFCYLTGLLDSVLKLNRRLSFDAKLTRDHDTLPLLRAVSGNVESIGTAFHNLTYELLQNAQGGLNPGLYRGATNSLIAQKTAVMKEVRGLFPEERSRAETTTTELYGAVENLCALVRGYGVVIDGISSDLENAHGFEPSRVMSHYETFRQDYTALTDSVRNFLQGLEVKFGKKVEFEHIRLLPLKSQQIIRSPSGA